jgi:hypothetical protein
MPSSTSKFRPRATRALRRAPLSQADALTAPSSALPKKVSASLTNVSAEAPPFLLVPWL